MARDFSKNTSNYMSLGNEAVGSLIHGASAISVFAWAYPDSYDTGANDNAIINVVGAGGAAMLRLGVDGSTGTKRVRLGGRSVSTDGYQAVSGTSDVPTGAWSSIGGVVNYSGDSITPYFNGAAENSSAVTFGNSAYTHSAHTTPDRIGGNNGVPPTQSVQFDGQIAEVAIWNSNIGAAGFAQLAKGVSALFVSPSTLVLYMPLLGKYSPERDLISGNSGTITGTVAAATHTRMYYPSKPFLNKWTYVAPAAADRYAHRQILAGVG